MGNIFEHDAVSTWSGYIYQGYIAVYLAVNKIYELSSSGRESEIKNYFVEMETCEDISFLYKDETREIYCSIHQVKNQEDKNLSAYKTPLVQLMLEKGYYSKNKLGDPKAFLHISNPLNLAKMNFSKTVETWKNEAIGVYEKLCALREELKTETDVNLTFEKIKACPLKKQINIERREYKNSREQLQKACDEKNKESVKNALCQMITFLENEFCVPNMSKEVQLFEYEGEPRKECYCRCTDAFPKIVNCIKKYKGEESGLHQEQYEYIADRLLCWIDKKIFERHRAKQEGKSTVSSIPLSEFKSILDSSVENYECKANVFALRRIYEEHLLAYCEQCLRKNENECQQETCRLQQPDHQKSLLPDDGFVRLCYNLNPECDKAITDRRCLNALLNKDGMMESVFPTIKEIPDERFVKGKTQLAVMNQKKNVFVTAISTSCASTVAEGIIKAMEMHPDLIKTVFEADQLVTTRLDEPSSVWDNNQCVVISADELEDYEKESDDEKYSIYVAKKPQFITFKKFMEGMGR